VRKDTDRLSGTSRFRVLGNIKKQIRVFLSETRHAAHWLNNVEGFDND
jgi:hypothetical protein